MPSEHSFVHHRTLESAFYDALPPGTYNNTFINNDVRGESRVFARGVSFPFLSFSLYVCLSLFSSFFPLSFSFFFFLCFKAEQLDVPRVTRRSAPFVASKRACTQRQCKVTGNSCDLRGSWTGKENEGCVLLELRSKKVEGLTPRSFRFYYFSAEITISAYPQSVTFFDIYIFNLRFNSSISIRINESSKQ